jgi:hypothetical protein
MRTITEDEFATAVFERDGWIDVEINREIDEGIVKGIDRGHREGQQRWK